MAYSTRLGVIPAAAIVAGVEVIQRLLGPPSSYDATHRQILAWATTILNDSSLSSASARDAWLRLRCWAGDQTVITPANTAELFGPGNVAQGCGCEVAHGCRTDAQNVVAELKQQIPSLVTGNLSTSPWTNPVTGQPTPEQSSPNTGTIYTTLPGGIQVGLPVPGSTIANSTIAGIPVWAFIAGGALLAFAGGSRRRN